MELMAAFIWQQHQPHLQEGAQLGYVTSRDVNQQRISARELRRSS